MAVICTDLVNIGSTLRILRENKGYTHEEVASYLHVKPKTVDSYERGNIYPSLKKFAMLMKLYGASADETLQLGRNDEFNTDRLDEEQKRFCQEIMPMFKHIISC